MDLDGKTEVNANARSKTNLKIKLKPKDVPIAYICQHDDQKCIISRTFIFYCAKKKTYCLRGLVGYDPEGDYPQFAYNCQTVGPVFDYLDFLNDKSSLYTYELFNICFPKEIDDEEITFAFLHDNKTHWLSAYDGQTYNKTQIGQLIRIVKGMSM